MFGLGTIVFMNQCVASGGPREQKCQTDLVDALFPELVRDEKAFNRRVVLYANATRCSIAYAREELRWQDHLAQLRSVRS